MRIAKIVSISLAVVLIIATIVLSVLGSKQRIGYISDFSLDNNQTTETEYVYHARIKYYDKVFRNNDIYGVYPQTDNLPEHINIVKWDEAGSPFGYFSSTKELSVGDKIDNIGYILIVKYGIILSILFFILSPIIFSMRKEILSFFSKYSIIKLFNILSYRKIKVNLNIIMILGYLYLLVPFIIFLMGWVKPIFSIPSIIILLLVLFFMIKDSLKFYNKVYSFNIFIISCILIGIALLVMIGGIGEIFPQALDFLNGRNAMLRDLINFEWPVVYPENGEAMVFYFAHWLVPAIFGKIFSLTIAKLVLIIWTSIGIFIAFLLLLMLLSIESNKRILIAFFVFMFFDRLPLKLNGYIFYEPSPTFTIAGQLFNQCAATYVMAALFLTQKNAKNFVFLGLLTTLYSAYAIIGILPFMLIKTFLLFKENKINTLKEVLSKENILSVISIFPILFLFLSANNTTGGSGFKILTNVGLDMIWWYIAAFALYMFLIYRDNKNNYLFFVCLFIFIGSSLVQYIGDHNFNRVNLSSYFILTFLIIKYLIDNANINSTRKYLLIIFLSLSASPALTRVNNKTSEFISSNFKINKEVGRTTYNTKEIAWGISTKPSESKFFKYIAKKN